jgi:tetratricopeptide (TPR) repeat protein
MSGLILWGSHVAAVPFSPEALLMDEAELTDYSLSDISEEKSRALVAFAEFMMLKDPAQRLDKLIIAIDNDPHVPFLIGCYIKELEMDKQKKLSVEYQAKLIQLARKHPAALVLNMTAAYLLEADKQYAEVIKLAECCINNISIAEIDDKNMPFLLNLINLYAKACVQLKDYKTGDRLFDRLTNCAELKNNLHFIGYALLFYTDAVEYADATKGFWWFSRSEQQCAKDKLAALYAHAEELCYQGKAEPGELILILELYRRNQNSEKGLDMLYSILLKAPTDRKTRIFLAVYYHNTGKNAQSIRIWRQIILKEPYQVKFYLELAKAAEQSGKFEVAAAAYRNYLNTHSRDYRIIYQLAVVYLKSGKFEEAEKLGASIPDSPPGLFVAARAAQLRKDYLKAHEYMMKSLEIAEKRKITAFINDDFYRTLAYICLKNGMVKEAVKYTRQLIKDNPEDPQNMNFLGYLWAEHDMNLKEAHELLSKALKLQPDNAAITDSMAWVLYRQQRYEEAEKYIDKALELSPPIPEAVIAMHAGDIYAKTGKMEKALKYWKMSLEIYCPEDELDRAEVRRKIKQHCN